MVTTDEVVDREGLIEMNAEDAFQDLSTDPGEDTIPTTQKIYKDRRESRFSPARRKFTATRKHGDRMAVNTLQ